MSAQPTPETTPAPADFRDELGKGWAKHRNGHNQEAIEIFTGVLQQDPQQINALYGLGLAQRANGDLQSATDSFQRCLAAANAGLKAEPESDQYEMLQRMVEQRLSEIRTKTN